MSSMLSLMVLRVPLFSFVGKFVIWNHVIIVGHFFLFMQLFWHFSEHGVTAPHLLDQLVNQGLK